MASVTIHYKSLSKTSRNHQQDYYYLQRIIGQPLKFMKNPQTDTIAVTVANNRDVYDWSESAGLIA